MNSRFDRAERTFHEALGQDPALREAFIASACASDESLQQEVKRLLAAHEAAASYFDRPASTEIEKEFARYKPEDPGERIGPYKLLEKIGEGGFGVVWVAEQEHPVRRRVALKIIKLGMDTKEIVARFEQERQALAMMDHPNIAKVFDAGATPTGRPFFVMELVRGLKLTDYCDQQQLPTRQRIELFIHVCQAVQHAHQKGIIHRDLKPANILVTINDGAAVPKVIDFGVAKATQGRLSDLTVYTQFEQMIGTPMYMSPEQAEMTSLDIDTRSDIYSLGVLLYELLTGRTPIAEDTLRRAGMDELRRVIREVDPVRPSLRIKELDGLELTTAAKRRQVEPGKLMTQLKGDVDWIVMKCLEKDRKRRYDTANGLAQDLRRHLNNELIAARPPTTGYLISKLVRRHKVGFAAGSAVAASIVIGFGVATWMFFKERDAKRRAVDAERQESSLRIRAETNERRAATEATKSQQVAQFLQDMLKGVGPAKARGKDPGMLKQILDETEERLSKDLRDQPIVEAEIRSTLGQVYYDLGDYKKAGDLRRRVLDLYEQSGSLDYAREAARARIDLGVTLCERGMLSEAQPLVEAGFAGIKQLDSGPTIDLAHALRGLGLVSWFSGNYVRGEASLREEVSIFQKLGLQNDSKYASALSDLSWLVHARGGAEDSEKLDSEALRIWESLYGEKHPSIVQSLNNLALSKWYQGKLEEAQQMFRRANDLGNLVMGGAHTELASPRNNLALVLRDLGQYDEAECNSREALALVMKGRGAEQQHSVQVRKNLSSILRRKADLAKDRTAIIEAFKLNPTEVANTKCLASMSVRERLTSLAPDEASKELPWRYTRAAPAQNWMAADFNDSAWQQSPAPAGVFTNYPRTPKTSIKGRSPLWLRRVISLAASPTKAVFISVGKYHDARIYINGVLAAPTADWSDVDFILRCSPQAQATLRPGRNSVAVLCEDAERSAPIEVRLLEGGEFSPDPVQFEFERLLNEEPERADLYAARAGYFASQGESQAAINSLTRSSELAAENWQYRASLALLRLVANDRLSYERDRSALLADFAKTERSEAAQETAFVALLVPAESAARDAADKLAAAAADQEYADAGLPARQLTKGLRDYRCDRFKEAIAACEKAKANAALKTLPGWTHERQRNLSVAADAIKAMAYQAVGQKTQAGETFLAAVEFADAEFPAMDGGDMGGDWKDLLAARTLLKEAQTTVNLNAGPR